MNTLGRGKKSNLPAVFPFALIYANNFSSTLSYSGPETEVGQTVRDIYNSGYECGAAESGNSPSGLGEKKEEVEDKIWNKRENGYGEMAREYRARREANLELRA